MVAKNHLLIWLTSSAFLIGSIALCVPIITVDASSPRSTTKIPSQRKETNALVPPNQMVTPISPPDNWIAQPPVLPAQLINATPISSDEVAWNNGAVQRRTVYRQVDGAHTLLLETSIPSSPLVTRYIYTADRLLLIEKSEDFNDTISRLRLQGLLVSQPTPSSPHAYVHLPTPGALFANLESIKQLVGSSASVQLDQMEATY